MLHSECQLIWTQINVPCWLILLLNLTSVIARLFGCSVVQERYLCLMTTNYELSYEKLLNLTNEISSPQRYLNSLMTEVYKCLNGFSPDIMNDTLAISKHRYNTWHYNLFVTDWPKTDRFGWNSIPYTANQIWNLLPREIKNSENLDSFKLKIKQWRCLECPCTLCKTYLPDLGYLHGQNLLAGCYFLFLRR